MVPVVPDLDIAATSTRQTSDDGMSNASLRYAPIPLRSGVPGRFADESGNESKP